MVVGLRRLSSPDPTDDARLPSVAHSIVPFDYLLFSFLPLSLFLEFLFDFFGVEFSNSPNDSCFLLLICIDYLSSCVEAHGNVEIHVLTSTIWRWPENFLTTVEWSFSNVVITIIIMAKEIPISYFHFWFTVYLCFFINQCDSLL